MYTHIIYTFLHLISNIHVCMHEAHCNQAHPENVWSNRIMSHKWMRHVICMNDATHRACLCLCAHRHRATLTHTDVHGAQVPKAPRKRKTAPSVSCALLRACTTIFGWTRQCPGTPRERAQRVWCYRARVEAFTAPEITSKKASSSEKTGVFLGTVAAVFEIVGVLAVGRGAFNGMLFPTNWTVQLLWCGLRTILSSWMVFFTTFMIPFS